MKKVIGLGVVASLVGFGFVAGVAVGKGKAEAKFIGRDEVKWEDTGEAGKSPKISVFTGDWKKGPFVGMLQIPAGFTSPPHSHSGDYEAVMIEGTSSHWVKGEDGTKAKKLTPGSYWSMPAKLEHVSACDKGKDCVILLMQKTKFDFAPAKWDDKKPDAAKPPVKPPAKDPVKKP